MNYNVEKLVCLYWLQKMCRELCQEDWIPLLLCKRRFRRNYMAPISKVPSLNLCPLLETNTAWLFIIFNHCTNLLLRIPSSCLSTLWGIVMRKVKAGSAAKAFFVFIRGLEKVAKSSVKKKWSPKNFFLNQTLFFPWKHTWIFVSPAQRSTR